MQHQKHYEKHKPAPDWIVRKLAKVGKKLKRVEPVVKDDKETGVLLLYGNWEIWEIIFDLVNSYRFEFSGKFRTDVSAFLKLSRLYRHEDVKLNYLKYKGVVKHLNEVEESKETREKRKSALKKPKGK